MSAIPGTRMQGCRRLWAAAAFVAATAVPAVVHAAVICVPNLAVDGSCTASAATISAAIAAASLGGGDTVLVGNGLYAENPVIDRQLILKAKNTASEANAGNAAAQAIIDGSAGVGYAVTVGIGISDVTIQGFEITNPTFATANADATAILVQTDSAGGPTVTVHILDNVIHRTADPTRTMASLGETGISAFNIGSPSTISGNTIYDIADAVPPTSGGESPGSGRAQGILVKSSNNAASGVTISNNTIHDVLDVAIRCNGVSLSPGKSFTVSDNSIDDIGSPGTGFLSGIGIDHFLAIGTISGNTITDVTGGFGLGVQATGTTSITGNSISTVVGGNGITFPGAGVLVNTGGASITNNLIETNALGIVASSGVTTMSANFNRITGNTSGGLVNGSTNALNGECNWWGAISGPTSGTNPGGAGQAVICSGGGGCAVDFVTWLVYSTDASLATPGFQLPASFSVTDTTGGSETAADNDYRRISNAVGCVVDNQTVTLSGIFDWTEANAAASWALGTDNVTATDDDWSAMAPANVNGVTVTAASLGAATIQGPGDDPTFDLETVFLFPFSVVSLNQDWTFSNLEMLDFDGGILMFNSGPVTQYNGMTITGNHIRLSTDLNATAAPADGSQNIALHLSFGRDQTISDNTIDIPGDGVSDSGGGNLAASVGLQSNTSGGAVYDGLLIDDNTVNVLNAQDADPEVVLGIWENAHGHTSDIVVSNNDFVNNAGGNNPASNLQRAFRVTSHSGASTVVTYVGNTADGANIGVQWISGSNFTGNQPVELTSSALTDCETGVLVQSNGVAHLQFNSISDGGKGVNILAGSVVSLDCNRITDNTTGIDSDTSATIANTNTIVGNGTGVDGTGISSGTMDATMNWWGCPAGPGGVGCDTVTANVDASSPLAAPPPCVDCNLNSDCADGLVCNGNETCDVMSGLCQSGMPPVCTLGPADPQCNDAICVEPTGCIVQPHINGSPCDTGDTCSVPDTCQTAVCTAGGGGDGDMDGTCNLDDNCPVDPNADQSDVDGDNLGDVCDPNDGTHNLARLRLRRQIPGRGNGSIRLSGDLLMPPNIVFPPPISVRVRDSLSLVETHTFSSCVPAGTGLRCTDTMGTSRFRLQLKPLRSTPQVVRYRVSFQRIAIDAPFAPPVEVTISHDTGVDRIDTMNDCRQSNAGLACREF